MATSSPAPRHVGHQEHRDSASRHIDGAARYAQLFVRNGVPVRFYLMDHEDPNDISPHLVPLSDRHVKKLTGLIERHGGAICNSMADAQVIIVNNDALDRYKLFYRFHADVNAEAPGFITKCINEKNYAHELPKRVGMGGAPKQRRPRRGFTEAEEYFLARYLALRIPDKNAGGRSGNSVYKELEDQGVQFDKGPWVLARNHSWHSWREKYVRNQQRFDELIDQYAAGTTHEKTLYGRYRPTEVRGVEVESEEGEDNEEGDEGANLEEQPQKRKRRSESPIYVDSDAEYVPSPKRARLPERESSDLSSDEYDGFEVQDRMNDEESGAGPSRSLNTPHRHDSEEPAMYIGQHHEETIPEKANGRVLRSTQQSIPRSSQITLVDPTQHSTRPSSAGEQASSSKVGEESRPRRLQRRRHSNAIEQQLHGPKLQKPSSVEHRALAKPPIVLVPRLKDITTPRREVSEPARATPETGADGEEPGIDENLANELPESPEVPEPEEENQMANVDEDYVNERPESPEMLEPANDLNWGELPNPEEVEEEESASGLTRGESLKPEDEEESSSDDDYMDLDNLANGSRDDSLEVDNLISPKKPTVEDDLSDSDMRAMRSIVQTESTEEEHTPEPAQRRVTRASARR